MNLVRSIRFRAVVSLVVALGLAAFAGAAVPATMTVYGGAAIGVTTSAAIVLGGLFKRMRDRVRRIF
ncbi:MAG: hypothetical protein ACREQB_12370 [Candidatus Binataceae bacterium]